MGGEKRHQMMQNLFGEQSEDEEEEEVDSEHEVARPSHYLSVRSQSVSAFLPSCYRFFPLKTWKSDLGS